MRKLARIFLVFCLAGTAFATTFTADLADKLNTSPKNELIRVLITMEEQADFDWMIAATATKTKMERRQFVIEHLNQIAQRTQAEVYAYLDGWQASGKVKHLQSTSIVNLLHCLATPEVIRGLKNFPEIAEIAYDPEIFLLDGVAPSSEPYEFDGGDEIAWGVADVHAPEVWNQGFNGTGVLVSVIDTGVNYNHLDLADHMWNGGPSYPNHGWDFYNNDNDPIDQGPLGHGTHCAGSVASDGTAGSQCGVAPNATIMAVQVLSGSGYGSEGQIISGINFSVQQGADIFSMSLGHAGGGTVTQKQQYRTACNNALAAGVIGAVAAGNENGSYPPPNNIRVPGNCPPPWLHPDQLVTGGLSCVVTCGATQSNHTIASFSSRGPVTWASISPWFDYAYNPGMGLIDPDISAPGVNIKSCAWNNNSGYAYMDGTSMATPHVAGGMALLLSKDPSLTPDLVDMYLEMYATDLGAVGKDNTFGSGLMNCLNSINAVPVGTGPYIIVADRQLDDIGGNNNGAPDPGETCSMVVTLNNVGQGQATNVVGTLTTADPFVTITQNTSYFPDLGHLQQGQGSPEFLFDVSSACPQGRYITCVLHVAADSAYTTDANITFIVGDPLNNPSGPDAYGYRAYDPYDAPELPVYNWVEISADSSGSGTLIAFTQDDQVFNFDLPFSFVYYGQTFNRYTVGANGWVAMGDVTADDYSNSAIPNVDGPEAMIAAYWEDLSPQRTNSGKVWRWYDSANHRLVVEYNHIEQYSPTGSFETFQVILYDPAHYPTTTGDGRIQVQYKEMSAAAQSEGTIGIENPAETIGIQYFFDGARDPNAHPITNRFAILYTTPTSAQPPTLDITLTPINPPIQIPAAGGSFNFNASVANNGTSPATFDTWIMVLLPSQSWYGPVLGPVNLTLPGGISISRQRTQNVPGSAPAGTYTYRGYVGTYSAVKLDSSSFDFNKLAAGGTVGIENWANSGESFEFFSSEGLSSAAPEAFTLGPNHPNPFNPVTKISFSLPHALQVKLEVFDVSGRLVATLVNGYRAAGAYEAVFDAAGMPSGLYFYRLEAGGFLATGKMLLLK